MNTVAITLERYQRTPVYVDAVQVTATNFLAVAEWCGGVVTNSKSKTTVEEFAGLNPNEQHIVVPNPNPRIKGRDVRAYVGDWITWNGKGFKTWSNPTFQKAFVSTPKDVQDFEPGEPSNGPKALADDEKKYLDREDETEKVSEDAVRTLAGPRNLTMAEAREEFDMAKKFVDHGTAITDLKGAAEAGGYPTSDDPLPEEIDQNESSSEAAGAAFGEHETEGEVTDLDQKFLEMALVATGVQTEKSRVCDLAEGAEFLYDWKLFAVATKAGDYIVTTTGSGEVVTFYSPVHPEHNDPSWLIEVLTDTTSSTKKLNEAVIPQKKVIFEAQPTEENLGWTPEQKLQAQEIAEKAQAGVITLDEASRLIQGLTDEAQ